MSAARVLEISEIEKDDDMGKPDGEVGGAGGAGPYLSPPKIAV